MPAVSADGFICTSGKAPELYSETLLPNVVAGLEAAGRKLDAIDRMIEMKVSFDTDKARALEDTRHWAALALTPEEKMSVEDPLEMERLADALPVERAASRWIVSTDPDEHVERIGPMSSSASVIWSSMPPAPTRSASSSSMPRRSCRGCAPASADGAGVRRARPGRMTQGDTRGADRRSRPADGAAGR